MIGEITENRLILYSQPLLLLRESFVRRLTNSQYANPISSQFVAANNKETYSAYGLAYNVFLLALNYNMAKRFTIFRHYLNLRLGLVQAMSPEAT